MTANPTERSRYYYDAGRRALTSDDLEEAIEALERSLEIWPHFKSAELLGEALLRAGRPMRAAIFLAAAIGLGTKPSRARYLLAKAYLEAGRKTEAFEQLRQALEDNQDYAKARVLLADLSKDEEIRAMIKREK